MAGCRRLSLISILLLLCGRTEVFAACTLAPGTAVILMCTSPADFYEAVEANGIADLGLVSFEDYPLGVYPNGLVPAGRPAYFFSPASGNGVTVTHVSAGEFLSGRVLRPATAGGLLLNFQAGPWVSALAFNVAAESVPAGSTVLVFHGGAIPLAVPATGGFLGLVGLGGQAIVGSISLGTVSGGIVLLDNVQYPGAPSSTQGNPYPPVPCPPGNPVGFCYTTVAGPQWYDPPATSAFRLTALDGAFTAISDFPTGFNAPFIVSVEGQPLGAFGPGQSVTFAPGTSTFVISGITPTVDAGDPRAFPIKLSLDRVGVTFIMEPVGEPAEDTTAPVTTASQTAPSSLGWHSTNVTVTVSAQDEAAGSGVNRIEYTLAGAQQSSGSVLGSTANIEISADGLTTLSYYAVDNSGNQEGAHTLSLQIDKTAPSVLCAAADGTWHGTDVSIACTGSDTTSGLANAADASFSLMTAVAQGIETAGAATGTRQVCDVAGNCTTAGPVGGNKVDRKAPVIAITMPTNTTYLLNQAVTAEYACADAGSGVSSCAGPVASGSQAPTSAPGTFTFSVTGTDAVMNSAPGSVSYVVAYGVRMLYDATRPFKSGNTIPIRLQLVDGGDLNVSASTVVVTARSLRLLSSSVSGAPVDAGSSNPDSDFRFDPAQGLYIFNLKTTGLVSGTYRLEFTAGGDPLTYHVEFQIR